MSLQSRHNKEQSKQNQFYLVKVWWCSYQSITDHYHHHDHHGLTISILYCLFPGMRTRWPIWRNWAVRAFFLHHRDPMIGFMFINILIMHTMIIMNIILIGFMVINIMIMHAMIWWGCMLHRWVTVVDTPGFGNTLQEEVTIFMIFMSIIIIIDNYDHHDDYPSSSM